MTSFTLAFTELWRILFLYFILLFAGAIWYVSHGPLKPGDNDKNEFLTKS